MSSNYGDNIIHEKKKLILILSRFLFEINKLEKIYYKFYQI